MILLRKFFSLCFISLACSLASQEVQWGGLSYISQNNDVSESFPYSNKLENLLRGKVLSPNLKSMSEGLPYAITFGGRDSYRDGSLSQILALESENVNSIDFVVGEEIKCLTTYSLSLQSILYSPSDQSILKIDPFFKRRMYLSDKQSDMSCKDMDPKLHLLRFLSFYLDKDYSNDEEAVLLGLSEGEMLERVLEESEIELLVSNESSLLGEFFLSLNALDLDAIKNSNFYVGISEVSFEELADKQLSGADEGFTENNYYSDFFGFKPNSFKVAIGQQFVKNFSKTFNFPLVPFVKGRALGREIALKFADSTELLNLKLPELDWGFHIKVRGFKKVKLDETNLREAFAFAAFSTVTFENVGIKAFTSIDVKNVYSVTYNKGDGIDNWENFNGSLFKSHSDYISNLQQPDKAWYPKNSNMKKKDFNKHRKTVLEKIGIKI